MLANLTSSLTTLITNLYLITGLLGIVVAMAIESCCIPLPSEIVMPVAGILAAQATAQRHLPGTSPSFPLWLNLILIALAGALGCLVGSIAAYGIGYGGGRPLMLKYGRYVLISQHDADKADSFFLHWGSLTTFFGRLLPVVRTYISLPAGIARMPFGKFCLYTVLGSFPWCLLLAYVGTIIGNNLDKLSPIFHDLDIVILLLVVLLIVLYVWRHIRNDRKARAEHAATESPVAAQRPAQPWNQQPPQQQSWQQPVQPQQGPYNQQQAWGQQTPNPPPQQNWGTQAPNQQPQQGWPPRPDDDRSLNRR
ncbi:MAG: DedA family protein [Chloroflexota bacterium]|nr:DedA family protein [Chloroflexota bacterium]